MGLMEKEGYKISYDTGGTWIVDTPARENIEFKRGTGEYYGMTYIDMIKNIQLVNMLQTVRMNYDIYTKKVEADILVRKV